MLYFLVFSVRPDIKALSKSINKKEICKLSKTEMILILN